MKENRKFRAELKQPIFLLHRALALQSYYCYFIFVKNLWLKADSVYIKYEI
jgi:hypothetical protein